MFSFTVDLEGRNTHSQSHAHVFIIGCCVVQIIYCSSDTLIQLSTTTARCKTPRVTIEVQIESSFIICFRYDQWEDDTFL